MLKTSIRTYKSKGFSLLETMLVLTVLALASVAVYKMYSPSSTQAAIKREQGRVETIVDGVFNAYTTASDFSTISTQTVSGILGLPLSADGQSLQTSLNSISATVRPSTSFSSNDSFDLVYAGVNNRECIGLIKALSSRSNGVFVGSSNSLQRSNGSIPDEASIITFCGQSVASNVAFRFAGQKRTFAATSMNSCICAPTSETQNIACPSGSSGTITQRRMGLCTGGTPACPSLAWSSWATILNTCSVNGATVSPTAPAIVVPPQTCIPSVETQTVACPAGQVGGILQQRNRSCPANTWSGWMQVSSSCQVDTARNTCTPRTVQSTGPCPVGQGGQESFEQTSTCDSNGNETWGTLKLIGSTCTASCVSTGTCCVVSRQNQTITGDCGIGRYGRLSTDQTRTSTCATPDATPVWPSTWIDLRNSGCNACPANTTATDTQDVTMTRACPAGQNGVISWISHQVRNRVYTYSCNSQPNITSLPSPDITTSGWVESSRSAETNSCVSATCSGPASETQWVNTSSGCPAGYTGSINWQREQSRSRTCDQVSANTGSYTVTSDTGSGNSQPYGCRGETPEDQKASAAQAICATQSAGYTDTINYCSDSSSHTYFGAMNFTCTSGTQAQWSSWSSWNDTGNTRNNVNSCVLICVPPASTSTAISRSVANENQTLGCAAGYTGSIQQTRTRTESGTRTTSWVCPGPTSSTSDSWSGSYTYGAWTTTSNTCVASCTPPAATNAAITRAVANENQTVACPAGQTGSITQTRTRTENGNRRTTWTCPGPTSSTTDTWLGTYNYGGWTQVTNTCTAPLTGLCTGPAITIACARYNNNGTRVTAIAFDSEGEGFNRGQYVYCTIGYANQLDSDGFPTIGNDQGRYILRSRGGGPISDWTTSYGTEEEAVSYFSVYARKADGTQGNRCYGEQKVIFNYNF